ncbi:MAG: DUF4214 domain-containing protein [Burkholderiales bacterium]|nr:DUF4214 domain-containing protein [Burkholderiales bacterium]
MKTLRRSTLSIATLLLLSACGGQIDSVSTQKKSMQAAPELAIAAAPADASFPEPRANYTIAHSEVGVTVTHITSKVATVVKSATRLQFSDMSMNLQVAQNAKTIAEKDLNSLIDLYIAFFNRAPDADGLNYWINSIKSGTSLDQIAASFYQAALAYPVQTGYSANMSNEDFVRIIYKNVLGRTGTTAPNDSEVKYWADDIRNGSPKSKLINTMLVSARTFASDKEWGWVTTLLNNKVAVGKYFAIEQGLNYNTPEDSITNTMKMVALITPTDVAAAKKTLALSETALNLSLSSGSGQGRMLDCFNPSLYAVGNRILQEDADYKDAQYRGIRSDNYSIVSSTFKGMNVLEMKGIRTSTGTFPYAYTYTDPIKTYLGLGKDELIFYGDEEREYRDAKGNLVNDAQGNAVKIRTLYSPALRLPFNLAVNESLIQNHVTIEENATSNEKISESKDRFTVTFLGIEEISVPLGRFNACKLQYQNSSTPPWPDTITYSWYVAEGPYRGLNARLFVEGRWLTEASKFNLTK